MLENIVFVAPDKVWTNHCEPSYWIGCPLSFGFLSETRLTILNSSVTAATVLIKTGVANSALVFDDAILIWLVPRLESPATVIAK